MLKRRVLLVAPRARMPDLAALVEAWREAGVHVERITSAGAVPDLHRLIGARDDLEAALVAGPAKREPASVLQGPFALDRGKRCVPVAWLPIMSPAALRRFAAAAARVHRRARERTTVALLGQWHPRYLHLADRIEKLLDRRVRTFRWTSEVIGRDELVEALGSGLGLALYVGHGRSIGWVGYRGLRARHFDSFRGEPLGGLVSLCCQTASRHRTELSFAESLPLQGITAASFGAVTETRHADNTRWAIRICDTLISGVETLGQLIARAAPPNLSASTPYRLIGDPLAPLAAGNGGAKRAARVPTYP
jgi:Peptidase family C25